MIDTWLEPLSESACGEDLEYDNEFIALVKAAAGKAETQFSAAEPPDWRQVRALTEGIFERTRDLRVAILWVRAVLSLDGARTLPDGMRLIHGLLQRYWDELHPRPDPDDGDAFARINALTEMASAASLHGDLRQSLIVRNRSIGELRGRDIELALGLLEPRADENPMPADAVRQMLAAATADDPALANLATGVLDEIQRISALMQERVGYERAPDLQPLTAFFSGLARLLPSGGGAAEASDSQGADSAGDFVADSSGAPRAGGGAPRGSGGGLGSRIETREDAVRAIAMVCDYLERTEPTSPAQLLLRRASRLVNKNFLELVKEFAPEAFGEVAKVMGVTLNEYGDVQ